jgi:hypothetical protein
MHSWIIQVRRQTRNRRTLCNTQLLRRLRYILIIEPPHRSARGSQTQSQHLRRRSNQVAFQQMQFETLNLRTLN